MKKLLPLAMAIGLMMPLAHAQKPADAAKEKPAAAATKKATDAVDETKKAATKKATDAVDETKKAGGKAKDTAAEKKKEAKAAVPSAADKKLAAEAKKETAKLTPAQNKKVLDLLNTGDEKAIEAVEGIGDVKAKAIVAKRPYAKVEDVVMVEGIGIETYKSILATANPAVKEEKAKATDKKSEKMKEKTTKPETKPAATEKEKATPKKPA